MARFKRLSPRELLRSVGAVHIRTGKHEIWKLPNNRIVTLSCTASDVWAAKNQLGDIRREMRKATA